MDENWNLQEGQKVSLNTYTNAEEVELFVNGKSYGTKKNPTDNPKKRDIIKWDNIEYHAGTVEAVAKSNGKIVARHKLTTTGEAVKLIAMPDQQTWHADGKDLLHIRVVAVDSKDRRVPTADTKLKFNVEGNAEIIAVSNGDITSDESLVGSERSLYQGSALVILRSTDKAGKIVFTATCDKLTSARLKLVTK
jgi:beta-galactosidase